MADDADQRDSVQRLIDRIRHEAVGAGRSEAAALVEQAKAEAAALLAAAQRERDELLRQARRDIEVEREAAHAAVHTAARDVILGLQAKIIRSFEAHVGRLVADTLRDPQLLRSLILVIAGRVAKEVTVDKPLEIVVTSLLDDPDRRAPMPAVVRDGILGISQAMLREGVVLTSAAQQGPGVTVKLVGEAVEIDLGADAITQLLLAYLSPRFRWILEGAE